MIAVRTFIVKRLFSTAKPQEFNFVPEHKPAEDHDVTRLKEFIHKTKNVVVVTGAGISTESGIPDYRSKGIGLYARSQRKPVQYQQFIRNKDVRRRFWTRNFVAWPRFSSHRPNVTHLSITELQNRSLASAVITMNVDGLHRKAGSSPLIELHGCSYEVVCLCCNKMYDRHELQKTFSQLNPEFKNLHLDQDVLRPDGDIDLPEGLEEKFNIPDCFSCGGVLMPNIVFFGDNVPPERVKVVEKCVSSAGGLLILGSSVSTYSAYRLCLQANRMNKQIAIVNIGETRADSLALIKIEARCGEVVPQLCS